MKTFISLLIVLLSLPAYAAPTAQTENATLHLHVDAQPDEDGIFWAAIEFKLADGWHIYWQNPGDSGLDAQINWTLPGGVQEGGIHWLPPQRIAYESLYNYGYEDEAVLLIPFKLKSENLPEGELVADIEYLICKDVCIPESAHLSAPLAAGDEALQKQFLNWREQLPEPFDARAEYDISGDLVAFAFDLSQTTIDMARIYHAWWYPIDSQIISNAAEQQWRNDGSVLMLQAAREGSAAPELFQGVLEVATTDGQRFHYHIRAAHSPAGGALPTDIAEAAILSQGAQDAPDMTLWLALSFAFLGGIILNLMPCVLPVLSLKALSIAKKSGGERAHLRREGLAYTAGILLSFLAVAGTLMALKAGGASIGWGFQLQSAGFVSALIYLLFVVGLNLSGAFEIPSALAGIGARLTHKDGAAGSFFTGVLATIVATPCTAPFMAGAIGFALTQPPALGLLIFAALGLGLAFPFLLMTFIPAATRYLPKPGAWMLSFRQLLAFPIYATIIWLLWVLVQQAGSMGLLHTLSGLLMIGFTLWLLGKLQKRAWQLGVLAAGAAALLLITDTAPSMDAAATAAPLDAASHAQPFSDEALESALASGKRVFVNATAAWCITCKVNERVALRDAAVQTALSQPDLVYFVADWTNRNSSIAAYLASFGRSGVPMYVYYAAGRDPVLLPQLLTPSIVLETLQGDAS